MYMKSFFLVSGMKHSKTNDKNRSNTKFIKLFPVVNSPVLQCKFAATLETLKTQNVNQLAFDIYMSCMYVYMGKSDYGIYW